MNIELFKVNLRKAIASLIPFARENKLRSSMDLLEEIKKYGFFRRERTYAFLPYNTALTIEEHGGQEFPLFSIVAWNGTTAQRPLTEDEKKETVLAVGEAFPSHDVSVLNVGFLGNPPPFKVCGVPKGTVVAEKASEV